jgi:hypothetical protein
MTEVTFEQWNDHFIEITSDWGHIGNIFWSNSRTMPHHDLFSYRLITYWGCFIPHFPVPGRMYGEQVPWND